jgi:cysteine synthase
MTNDILNTIGNTPLVKLRKMTPANAADIYIKLEFFNPTGSYKDRMALAMIEGAEQRGALRPGMKVAACPLLPVVVPTPVCRRR